MLRVLAHMMMGYPTRSSTRSAGAVAAADRILSSPRPSRHTGTSWFLSSFIVFALLILLGVPIWLERTIAVARAEDLQPAQDARGVVNDVRHALSEAEASFRGYLLTGDARLRDALVAAHAAEAQALAELRSLADQLGPVYAAQVEALRRGTKEEQWRRLAALDARDEDDVALQVRAHAELVAESEALRAALIDRIVEARTRIRSLEQTGLLIMTALGGVALAAALMVIVMASRDRRTARLEAELRVAALSLAEATQVEDIVSRIAASAARTVPRASCFVESIDEEADEVTVVTTTGRHVLPKGTGLPFPGSLTEAALRSGTPEQFRVASMAERPSTTALRAVCGDCSGVVIPLIADRDPQGALVLLRPGRRGFGARQVRQLRVFGVFAALALRRAVLLARAVEQRREVARLARARERMVRGFSHDLKNPLGAADGHAALLHDEILGSLKPAQHEHVGRIRASLRAALDIIDDIVELARAETGQLTLRRTRVDPAQVVADVAAEYDGAAAAAGLDMVTHVAHDLPPLETDSRRVRQVLGNLVSNAIKYTPEGGRIRLTAALRRGRHAADPRRWLTFAVEDNGPGIPESELPHLFQEFHRAGSGSAPGVGLGLAISERVARLLGGEIRVDTELGRGSTFTLWLPCADETLRDAA